jgi:hypothetical protein
MGVLTSPINAVQRGATWSNQPQWNKTEGTESAPAPLTAKGERSIAPQNIVAVSWGDVVDAINPLQQLPIVGEIYRGITGEKISGIARVAGGFIYGGLAGGLVAALSAAYAESHGDQTPVEHLVASLAGKEPEDAAPQTTLAAAAMPAVETRGSAKGEMQSGAFAATGSGVPPEITIKPVAAPVIEVSDAATNAGGIAASMAEPLYARMPNGELMALPAKPLRERLNQKNTIAGVLQSAPVVSGSFVDRLPAGAATRSLERAQNLELLQGTQQATVNKPPKQAETIVAEGKIEQLVDSAQASPQPSASPQGNPLPPELVRDMMMSALDKYQQSPAFAKMQPKSIEE